MGWINYAIAFNLFSIKNINRNDEKNVKRKIIIRYESIYERKKYNKKKCYSNG